MKVLIKLAYGRNDPDRLGHIALLVNWISKLREYYRSSFICLSVQPSLNFQ